MSDCRCNGTGKLVHDTGWTDENAPIGDGLYISAARSVSSALCPCRKALEPRDGDATWWDSEVVFEEVWQSQVHQHVAEITVRAEVPISEDNYRVHRRGNRYSPTMVDVDLTHDWLHALHPEDARALAALLNAAADKCDEIDEQDADECGHWFPCDCGKAAA